MKTQTVRVSQDRLFVARKRFQEAQSHFPSDLQRIRFEDALDAFANCLSLAEAGRALGIGSRQEASRIYRDVFAELFPWTNGRERRGNRTRARRDEENEKLAAQLPATTLARAVALAAREQGLAVKQLPLKGGPVGKFKSRVLLIEDRLCALYSSSRVFRAPTGTRYSRVKTCRNVLGEHQMAIARQNVPGFPERLFVIPCEVLVESWNQSRWVPRTSSSLHLYLPLEESTLRPKVDFLAYVDGWHLLRGTPAG